MKKFRLPEWIFRQTLWLILSILLTLATAVFGLFLALEGMSILREGSSIILDFCVVFGGPLILAFPSALSLTCWEKWAKIRRETQPKIAAKCSKELTEEPDNTHLS